MSKGCQGRECEYPIWEDTSCIDSWIICKDCQNHLIHDKKNIDFKEFMLARIIQLETEIKELKEQLKS